MPLELNRFDQRSLRNGASWLERNPERLDEERLLDEWAEVLARRGTSGFPETLAAYVHVPYCHTRCTFCMYFMSAFAGQETRYVDYALERLERFRQRTGRLRASSLFMGGGTPSILAHRDMERLLNAIGELFEIEGDATMEAHPGTLDSEKIALMIRGGINRISLGIQSTEPAVLEAINRQNPPRAEIAKQVETARRLGAFVNVDLVIGLPQQTREGLQSDVKWALSMHPRCLTLYRYQPVQGIPDDGLHYRDLTWRALIETAIAHGFLPLVPRRPEAYCASFLRLVPQRTASLGVLARRARAFFHLFRSGALHRPLPAGARLEHFTGFDVPSVNVCGFGPGSISHLFGRAWYRDSTRPSEARAGLTPELTGARISLDEELRRAVAADFVAGRWVRSREYRGSLGLDPTTLLRELPGDLKPALQRHDARWRLTRDHPRARDVLSWLVPAPTGPANLRLARFG